MPNVRVGVSLDIQESSLRQLQQNLIRAVSNISPRLNLDIDEGKLKKLLNNQIKDFKIDVNANISDAGKRALARSIREVTDNVTIRNIGFDRKELTKLRKEFSAALEDVESKAAEVKSLSRQAKGKTGQEAKFAQAVVDTANKNLESAQEKLTEVLNKLSVLNEKRAKFEQVLIREEEKRAAAVKKQEELARKQAEQEQKQIIAQDKYIETLKKRASKRLSEEVSGLDQARKRQAASLKKAISDADAKRKAEDNAVRKATKATRKLEQERNKQSQSLRKSIEKAEADRRKEAELAQKQIVAQDEYIETLKKRASKERQSEVRVLDDVRKKQAASLREAIKKSERDRRDEQKAIDKATKEVERLERERKKQAEQLRKSVESAKKQDALDQKLLIAQDKYIKKLEDRANKREIADFSNRISPKQEPALSEARKQFGQQAQRELEFFVQSIRSSNQPISTFRKALTLIANQFKPESSEGKLKRLRSSLKTASDNVDKFTKKVLRLEQNVGDGDVVNFFKLAKAEEELARAIRSRARAQERVSAQEKTVARERAASPNRDTVVFRGARDIANFGAALKPQELSEFVKLLTSTSKAGKSAQSAIRDFQNTLKSGQPTVDRLRASLRAGEVAAFDFGTKITQAARRLLEWATPAAFIFSTISRLQSAVSTLAELDRQARRLEFFQTGSNLSGVNKEAITFNQTLENSQRNLQGFLDISRRTGISVQEVAEAFVTASRVGVTVSDTLEKASRSGERLGRSFETTVLSLVRLEAGALSAEQAVRRLRAIQAQFIDTLGATNQEADQAISNIGDILAVAAAKSSFSVNELASATARLGTSLQNLQGSNPQAVISLIAEAARVTGAEVGRLSTTFRQLTTLTVQNAEKIKQATGGGIEIVDPDSGQQTFSGQLKFLRELSNLQKTDALAADQFARLGTDRRNVNELKQLAATVEQLERRFGDLSTAQAQLAIAGSAARETFIADQNQAESLDAALKRLSAEFDNLANTITGTDTAKSIVDIFSSGVSGVSIFVDALKGLKPLLAGLVAFIAASVGPKIAAVFAGAGASIKDALSGGNIRNQISADLAKTSTAIDGINAARQNGLISSRKAADLTKEQLINIQHVAIAEEKLVGIERRIDLAKKAEVVDTTKLLALEKQRFAAANQLIGAAEREAAVRKQTAATIANSTGSAFTNPAFISGVGVVATTVGTLFASKIAEGFRQDGSKKVAAAIQDGTTTALIGGTVGAQIGTAIAPGIGTAIGAILGTFVSGALGAAIGFSAEEAKIQRQRKVNLEGQLRTQKAIAAQRRLINLRAKRDLDFARNKSKADREILILQQKIAQQNLTVQSAQGNTKRQAQELKTLAELQEKLEASKAKLQREQLAIQARQIAFANEQARIRRQEREDLQRLNLLRVASLQNATKEQEISIRLEFDRKQVSRELQTIKSLIAQELEQQQTTEFQIDSKKFEQSNQRVLDLQSKARILGLKLAQKEIQSRKQLQDRQKQLVQEQVSKLENANKNYISAIKSAFDSQLKIAQIIARAGDLSAKALASRGQEFLSRLEAQGQLVSLRLFALENQAERELAQLKRNQQAALQSLDNTGVSPLNTITDINSALDVVAKAITDAAKRSGDKIFDKLTGTFDRELIAAREREQLERANIKARIQITKQENSIRIKNLQAEIGIIQKLADSERRLQELRIDQQREFGRILLQGPEAFNKAIQAIQQSRAFFQNIQTGGNTTRQENTRTQILEIARRAINLRDSGQFAILQDIQKGLQVAIRSGQPSQVAGLTNTQLLRIFEQVLSANIPGGTTGEDVAVQFERQLKEQERQTARQKEIELRQRAVQELTLKAAQLQQIEIALKKIDINVAKFQREKILFSANQRLRELITIRVALLQAVTNGVKISNLPDSRASGGRSSGLPKLTGSSPSNLSVAITKALVGAKIAPGQDASSIKQQVAALTQSEVKKLRIAADQEIARINADLVRKTSSGGLEELTKQAIKENIDLETLLVSVEKEARTKRAAVEKKFEQDRRNLLARQKKSIDVLIKSLNDGATSLPKQLKNIDAPLKELAASLQKLKGNFESLDGNTESVSNKFKNLPIGLRPPGATGGDNIPGIRSNAQFSAVFDEFLRSATVNKNRGVGFEARDLQLLRDAIKEQGGGATPRQARRLRELERQTRFIGGPSRFTGERAARRFTASGAGRRAAESGFRGIAQGNTQFIRGIRDLTQTFRGTSISARGKREFDTSRFIGLLKDAGFSGIAGGIDSRREAVDVAQTFLKLSEGLQKNQAVLRTEQRKLIEKLLGKELQDALSNGLENAFKKAGSPRGIARRPNETSAEFERRKRVEQTSAAKAATQQALENKKILEETASAVAAKIGEKFSASDEKRAADMEKLLGNLKEVKVKLDGKATVAVDASVKTTLVATPEFKNAMRSILPNISQEQLNAMVSAMKELVKVEQSRGTPLPPSASSIGNGPAPIMSTGSQ